MTMEETSGILRELRDAPVREPVADLGVVAENRSQSGVSQIRVSIECWQEVHYVCISTNAVKSGVDAALRVVRWPYSVQAPQDMGVVLADLQVVIKAAGDHLGPEQRSWLVRGLDRLAGRQHLGTYRFVSPIPHVALKPTVIEASLSRWRGQLELSLSEQHGAGAATQIQFPHAVCEAIRAALTAYAGARR